MILPLVVCQHLVPNGLVVLASKVRYVVAGSFGPIQPLPLCIRRLALGSGVESYVDSLLRAKYRVDHVGAGEGT